MMSAGSARSRSCIAPDFATPGIEAGVESLEVRMFAWEDIPWDDIAFPTVHWALHAWRDAGQGPLGAPAGNPATDRRGTRAAGCGAGAVRRAGSAAGRCPARHGRGPRSSFVTATPMPDFTPSAARGPTPALAPPGYAAAPDAGSGCLRPQGAAHRTKPPSHPGLFTRRDQYRGEGLSSFLVRAGRAGAPGQAGRGHQAQRAFAIAGAARAHDPRALPVRGRGRRPRPAAFRCRGRCWAWCCCW